MALFCAVNVNCDVQFKKNSRQNGRGHFLKFLLYVTMAFYILVNFYVEIFYSVHHCIILHIHVDDMLLFIKSVTAVCFIPNHLYLNKISVCLSFESVFHWL